MSRLAAADARERFAMDDVVAHYEAFYAEKLGARTPRMAAI
jgi:hypothetical protein